MAAAATGSAGPKKDAKKNPVITAVAGFGAGATEASVTMPFDTVKTYCQTQSKRISPFAGAREIMRYQGIGGLYFGLPAVLVQVAGKGGIRFAAFEQCKHGLEVIGAPAASVDFLGGIGAGFCEAFLWTAPTERLKVLRQNDIRSGLNRYASLTGAVRTVIQEHGVTGLYAGIGACGLRQATGVGVRFAIYGRVKQALTTEKPQVWLPAIAGGITGCIGAFIGCPIDVVKTRIEAQDSVGKPKEYTGTVQAAVKIVKEEGFLALYKGLSPRMMKITLGQAITFFAYETYADALTQAAGFLMK
mmetsp:Transcript_32606/g.74505  ORF Transcript_32606/g.74505 Transcript_32606/m.74505 type:complete len:302 (+) Transcript_32606:26-931(+)